MERMARSSSRFVNKGYMAGFPVLRAGASRNFFWTS